MKLFFGALLLCLLSIRTNSQTLQDYINQGITNSFQIQKAKNDWSISKAEFAVYQATLKPDLALNGNVPSFNKDNFEVRQPDGSLKFLNRSQNFSNLGFSFTQPLPFSGGSLSLNTDLIRFDDFVNSTKQYNGTPAFLQLNQPLFAYNKFKWDKKIEPLKMEEARLTYQLQANQLSLEICQAFFAVVLMQTEQQLAKLNLEHTITNLVIEKRRVQLGVSTEDKILQLEMQQLNLQQALEEATLGVQHNFVLLRMITNSADTGTVLLPLPEIIPSLLLNKEELLRSAKKELPMYISFHRKLLEAAGNTARIKGETNQVTLTASVGLTNAGNTIPSIYQNPNDQQRFSIGFSIPLATWGKRKNNLILSKLRENQVALSNHAEEASYLGELTNLITEIPVIKRKISRSFSLDTLAQKRLAITNRLYQSGKVSLIDVQASQTERDNSRRNYIVSLKEFWTKYYSLRTKVNNAL